MDLPTLIVISFSLLSSCLAAQCKRTDYFDCDIEGKLSFDEQKEWGGGVFKASTVEACALICKRTYSNGFSYEPKHQLCQMLEQSIYQVTRKNNTGIYFYDPSCWRCGRQCPQPAGQQILYDGDFEEGGLNGPWVDAFEGKVSLIHDDPHRHAWECVPKGKDLYSCSLSQLTFACKGSNYLASFDYKWILSSGNVSENSFGFVMSGLDYPNPTVQTIISETSGIWKTVKAILYYDGKNRYFTGRGPRPGANFAYLDFSSSGYLDEKGNGPRRFLLDNIVFSRLPGPLSVSNDTPEVLVNGGFETGDLTPWYAPQHKYKPSLGHDPSDKSKYALYFHPFDKNYYNYDSIRQNVTVNIGSAYMIQFDTSTENEFGHVDIIFGGEGTDIKNTATYNPDNGHHRRRFVFVASSSDSYLELRGHHVIIDNVSLRELDLSL